MGDFCAMRSMKAVARGLTEVVIGGMVGKLTKIARVKPSPANRAEVDTELLANWPQALVRRPRCAPRLPPPRTARFDCRAHAGPGPGRRLPCKHWPQAVVRA